MSLLGLFAFQGISSPVRACLSPPWASLLLGISWEQGTGRVWSSTSSWPDPRPSLSGGAWVPCLPFMSHSFPFPSYPHLGLLLWVIHPLVGRLHPSPQPLAPAASGMLQPPVSMPPNWARQGAHWCGRTPGDVSIFIGVSKVYMLYTENHLLQRPTLPHPTKRFSNPCSSWGSGIGSWIVPAAVPISTSSYWGE